MEYEAKSKHTSNDDLIIADIHKQTAKFKNAIPDKSTIPPIFKKINAKKIPLPMDFEKSSMNVEDAIAKRASWRDFSGYIDLKDASKVLYYANGFKGLVDTELGILQKTNAPSAGSRHPIELYLILQRVNGINDGVYHYEPEEHMLEAIEERTIPQEELLGVFNTNKSLINANMIILMSAIHGRSSWKYGPRAYRFIHLDAGHIGQNLYLISEAMGLGACGVGGWKDDAAEKLLKIDGLRELIVYMAVVGKKAGKNSDADEL